jgi:FKBP-type peptidyl-prolyl cis-trans isomerase
MMRHRVGTFLIISLNFLLMKRILWSVVVGLCMVGIGAGCSSKFLEDEAANSVQANETAIKNYLDARKLTAEKSNTGLYYIFQKKNPSGAQFKVGDQLSIHYHLFTLNGALIDSTDRAKKAPATFTYGVTRLLPGMEEALTLMRTGEEVLLMMPNYLAYGNQPPNGVDSYAAIGCRLDLVAVRTEDNQIDDYIKSKSLTLTETTSTGLRFIKTATTTGAAVAAGQTVTVKYSGKLLNDKVFDSGEYTFRVGSGGAVAGFDEGVSKLKIGEKATIIFPSKLGYAERGSGTTIPPFAPLVFDIELLK